MKKLNVKFATVGIMLLVLGAIVVSYFAGLASVSKATSTNSDLTITETEDGYAHHDAQDPWIYGQDEYTELVPYVEDTEAQQENPIDTPSEQQPEDYAKDEVEQKPENYPKEEISEVTGTYPENETSEEPVVETPSGDNCCGITGHLEVLSCEYDNSTGTAIYECLDYYTNTRFTIRLNYNNGVEEVY